MSNARLPIRSLRMREAFAELVACEHQRGHIEAIIRAMDAATELAAHVEALAVAAERLRPPGHRGDLRSALDSYRAAFPHDSDDEGR